MPKATTKHYKTYAQLDNSPCPRSKDEDQQHAIWLGLTGDSHPAFCVWCGAFTNKVPARFYENL